MRREKEPEEPKPTGTPGFANSTVIFEQVAQNVYLVFDRVTQKYHVFPYTNVGMTVENHGYVPLPRLPWPSVRLPENFDDPETLAQTKQEFIKAINEGPPQNLLPFYESEESLFNEIKDFWLEHLDIRNPLLYDVYAAFTLMTWRIEDFKVIPYLMFLGPLASGKTRGLECLKYLGYRSILASSMSAATIFRTLEAWHCLLLLDETEIYGRESMVEVLALLNSGYRRGQYAIRIEKLEGQVPQIAMFDVFGPKGLAGTEELAATLQSRAILTTMSKNVKHIRLFVDEEKAQELRNKLLLYRFRNLGSKSEFDISVLNGYFQNARVIELFVSLLEVAPTQEIRDRLIQCMKSITQTRLDEEQQSIDAQVFEAIANSEDQVEFGKLSIRAIVERFNTGLAENEQVTPYFIGRRIAALGFEKCRLSHGLRGFFLDKELVERLRARYFPVPKTPSQTSLTSQTSPDMEKQCEPKTVTCDISDGSPSSPDAQNQTNTVKSDISDGSDGSDAVLEPPTNTDLVIDKPTIQEILESVRPRLPSVFPEEKLLNELVRFGLAQENAQKYLDHFKEKEIIIKDDVGNWYFVR